MFFLSCTCPSTFAEIRTTSPPSFTSDSDYKSGFITGYLLSLFSIMTIPLNLEAAHIAPWVPYNTGQLNY